jgi:hypothetical protein
MLNKGGTIPLSQQRGGRLVHRLFYSILDTAWFVAVQDDNDGGVLTTLPLPYFENLHGPVSGLNRRRARKLARDLEARKLEQLKLEEAARAARLAAKVERQKQEEAANAARAAAKERALAAQQIAAAGWRVTVQICSGGKMTHRYLGRTVAEYGQPDTWVQGHPVHGWFRERLDARCIPVRALRGAWLERGANQQSGEVLLEHLILSEQELQEFC